MSRNLFPEIAFNEIHTGKVFSDDNIAETPSLILMEEK
jgi:hypothetical protein